MTLKSVWSLRCRGVESLQQCKVECGGKICAVKIFLLQFDVLCVVLCSGNCCVLSVSVWIFFIHLLCVFFINLLHHRNLLHLTPLPRFTGTSSSMGVFHLSSDRPSAGRETCTPARSRNSKTAAKSCSTEPGRGKILLSTINAFAFKTESLSWGWSYGSDRYI